MKKAVVFMYAACVTLLFASCLTTPEPVAESADAVGTSPAPAASVVPGAPAGEGAPTEPAETLPAEPALSEDPAAMESDQPELSAEPSIAEAAIDETPLPEDKAPVPPPGERVITFYPEPDLFVPELTPAAPAEVPAAAAVTAAPAVPQALTVPSTASSAAKADLNAAAGSSPAEKAAEITAPTEVEKETVDAGIWTTEPTAPSVLPAEKTESPAASRSATLAVGQNLQVWYPGSGWVYLGDASTLNGLAYDSRKLDKSDTLFLFKALKEGSYTLDFSRYDVLSDSFSEDALAVTVLPAAKARTGLVRAPDYRSGAEAATAVPAETPAETAAPVKTSSAAASAITPAPAATPLASSSVISDEPALVGAAGQTIIASGSGGTDDGSALLETARSAIAGENPAAALTALDSFFSKAVKNLDEGWFLRGQAYEANGASKNIKKALDAYQTLVSAYPESSRWKDADARIRYIKRFYLGIR